MKKYSEDQEAFSISHPAVIAAKLRIEAAGFRVHQCSPYHLKYGEFNLWPTSGKITIDPATRHPERGVDAFIELLERRYGARRKSLQEMEVRL